MMHVLHYHKNPKLQLSALKLQKIKKKKKKTITQDFQVIETLVITTFECLVNVVKSLND